MFKKSDYVTVHTYQGLLYKTRPMRRDIFNHPQTRILMEEAGDILGTNVSAFCEGKSRYFRSTSSCFVVNFVAPVAVGRHNINVEEKEKPDFIFGHSFGHYPGLVMSGSLDFSEVLRLVNANGKLIDEHFMGQKYSTMLVDESLDKWIISTFGETSDLVKNAGWYSDGTSLTATEDDLSKIEKTIDQNKIKKRRVLIRPPYHTDFMLPIEVLTHPHLAGLNISMPHTPFVSSVTAEFVKSVGEIKDLLHREMSAPAFVDECLNTIYRDSGKIPVEYGIGMDSASFLMRSY